MKKDADSYSCEEVEIIPPTFVELVIWISLIYLVIQIFNPSFISEIEFFNLSKKMIKKKFSSSFQYLLE